VAIDVQQERFAHRRGLLADREMGRSLVVVGDVLMSPHPLDVGEHLLELADEGHVAVDADSVVGLQVTLGDLVSECLAVAVDRNRSQGDCRLALHITGDDDKPFHHVVPLPSHSQHVR
jgi:hypothetical protein